MKATTLYYWEMKWSDMHESSSGMDDCIVVEERNRTSMLKIHCKQDTESNVIDDTHKIRKGHWYMSDGADHKPGNGGCRMDRDCIKCESSIGDDKDCTMIDKDHKCDICSKTFSKISGLTGHRATHTGEYPYICLFCEKGFNVRSNLNAHLRIHTGQKPFECAICKKSFTQKGQLTQHQRIHSGELPYVCGTCDKAFRNGSALVTHLRTHTGEKPYRCDICSRSFTTSTSLKTHRVTHSGEMLFECPMCKRQFNSVTSPTTYKSKSCRDETRRNNLNVHIKRHNKDRSFSCPLCHNGFVMRAHLLRHLKRSHKIDCERECITNNGSILSKTYSHSTSRQIANSEQPYNYANKACVTEETKSFSGSPSKRLDPNNKDSADLMMEKEIKQEKVNDGMSYNVLITGSNNGDAEMKIKDTFAKNDTSSLNKAVLPENVQVKQEVGNFRIEDFKPDGNEIKEENIVTLQTVKEVCPDIPPDDLESDGFLTTKEDSYKTILTCIKQEPLDSQT